MKEIVLAGGCFWGIEEYFSRMAGVVDTEVGYANGHTEHPTYRQVCTGNTGHAEVCKVVYEEGVLSLGSLLDRFWKVIDPTVKNRQGPDAGSQYRTGIYYRDLEDRPVIEASKDAQQTLYAKPIVTEIEPLTHYSAAEEYHQDYLKKNPGGYCHIDLSQV